MEKIDKTVSAELLAALVRDIPTFGRVALYARDFAADCEWQEDPDDIAAMDDTALVLAASRHYSGGLVALVRDALAELGTGRAPSVDSIAAWTREH